MKLMESLNISLRVKLILLPFMLICSAYLLAQNVWIFISFFFLTRFRVQSLLKMKLWSVATPDTCKSASCLYSSNAILLEKRKDK